MPDPQFRETMRVFVAYPGDMKPERDAVAKVVSRLNDTTASHLGFQLELRDWSEFVRPSMGRPQKVVFDQIPVETWDIFIGLLWMRFGTPTGALDPVTGLPFAAGTQEEFHLAYESWQNAGKPNIMFYRCLRPAVPVHDDDEIVHLTRVNEFFKQFEHDKANPGMYRKFIHGEEFVEYIHRDLTDVLFETWRKRKRDGEEEGELVPDQAYDAVVLSVDIVASTTMVQQHPQEAPVVFEWFESFVSRICAAPHWTQLNWTPDGGLLVTVGEGRQERAALAGIRLLHELELNNLDPSVAIKFSIRVAADDGPLVWRAKKPKITADVVNNAKHVESEVAESGEFCVTDKLYVKLGPALAAKFRFKRRFRERQIFSHRGIGATEPPPSSLLDDLVSVAVSELKRLGHDPSATSRVDAVYGQLDRFSGYFPKLDERWSPEYVARIREWTTKLADAERAFWDVVQTRFAEAPYGSSEYEHWTSVAPMVGNRRRNVVLLLDRLRKQTELALGQPQPPQSLATVAPPPAETTIATIAGLTVSDELREKIVALIAADELREEELFADLMANEREALVAAISSVDALGEMRDDILTRLWSLSDLILIEELVDGRAGLFTALLRTRLTRARYTLLVKMLNGSTVPSEEDIRGAFAEADVPFALPDLHVVWRCVLVGVPNLQQRIAALRDVPVQVLWRTIAAANIQVSALWAAATRFESESEDTTKIFFDCIHARLMREIKRNGREMRVVGRLISHFFKQPLFVQSPYFERLDDLLASFRSSAGDATVDVFDKLADKLKQIHQDLGNPQASVPEGIHLLPLPVQRHLASEGRYLDSFVLHPNYRIARETLPFITIANVERLMEYRQINDRLFHQLQKRKEFFGTINPVMTVLLHPKCLIDFVRTYLPKVGAANVRRVAASPSAHPAVRELAKKMVRSK